MLYPRYLDVLPIEAIRQVHSSAPALLFRIFPDEKAAFDITEIPCAFPVRLSERPPGPGPGPGLAASIAKRLTYTASYPTSGVGLVCTGESLGFLNSNGEFFVQYPDLEGMHSVAVGVKQAIANNSMFCLVTTDNRAMVCDSGGNGMEKAGTHVRRVAATPNEFAVLTDTSVFIVDASGHVHDPERLECEEIVELHARSCKPYGFLVRTKSGRVWCSSSGEFLALPPCETAVQMHATQTEIAVLASSGKVYVSDSGGIDVQHVQGTERIADLFGNHSCVLAIHRSGDLYAWSGEWFKPTVTGITVCPTACRVYGLNANHMCPEKVSVSRHNWLVGMKDGTYFSFGNDTHVGPVVGMGDKTYRFAANDAAHACVRTNGRVCVMGSPVHGGVNENGEYGLVDIAGPVTDICARYATFAAILEPMKESMYVWGSTRETGLLDFGAPVENAYVHPDDIFTYVCDGKFFRGSTVVMDLAQYVKYPSVCEMVHNDNAMYVVVTDMHKSYTDPDCRVRKSSTVFVETFDSSSDSDSSDSDSDSDSDEISPPPPPNLHPPGDQQDPELPPDQPQIPLQTPQFNAAQAGYNTALVGTGVLGVEDDVPFCTEQDLMQCCSEGCMPPAVIPTNPNLNVKAKRRKRRMTASTKTPTATAAASPTAKGSSPGLFNFRGLPQDDAGEYTPSPAAPGKSPWIRYALPLLAVAVLVLIVCIVMNASK